jgi:acetyl-CoA carboxylase carboxyl transferase subunit alpha
MSQLKVPIVAVVTGEGGSGGALAIGVGDRVLMLQNSYYAVCTPEACATILFKDRSKASAAVSSMKIMGEDLLAMGIVDEIVPEPLGGAHYDWRETADNLKQSLLRHLDAVERVPRAELPSLRYGRFRKLGQFEETKRKAIPLQKTAENAEEEASEEDHHASRVSAVVSA